MNKTWIIIKREYLSRVTKKTFLLTTLLTPLLFAGVIAAITYTTIKSIREEKIAVVDHYGTLRGNIESSKSIRYEFTTGVDTSNFADKGYSAILLAPQLGITESPDFSIITKSSLTRIAETRIKKDLNDAIENKLISQRLKIDPLQIDEIKKQAQLLSINISKQGKGGGIKESNFGLASSIGYATGFLIYFTLFIYGVMVMRGVMEEKTNRIAEVVISSVKPFQLMLGKIVGIGAVGLTQFLLWIVLIGIIVTITGALIPPGLLEQVQNSQGSIPGTSGVDSGTLRTLATASKTLSSVNWPLVIGCFLFYFLGGYLFYAALFAAVGSAVNEDSQDAQSLTLPITLPIFLGIFFMANAVNDPGSSLATWTSIIPFFSPIVMVARIPFGVPDTVPYWQLGMSMVLLIAGFLGTTWLSAKVYRTGILMYGKKPSWREMAKWIAH